MMGAKIQNMPIRVWEAHGDRWAHEFHLLGHVQVRPCSFAIRSSRRKRLDHPCLFFITCLSWSTGRILELGHGMKDWAFVILRRRFKASVSNGSPRSPSTSLEGMTGPSWHPPQSHLLRRSGWSPRDTKFRPPSFNSSQHTTSTLLARLLVEGFRRTLTGLNW